MKQVKNQVESADISPTFPNIPQGGEPCHGVLSTTAADVDNPSTHD